MTRGAKKLVSWRKALGLSQAKAAVRLKVSQATMCDWESGAKRPDIDQLVRLVSVTADTPFAIDMRDFAETPAQAAARRERRTNRPNRRDASAPKLTRKRKAAA